LPRDLLDPPDDLNLELIVEMWRALTRQAVATRCFGDSLHCVSGITRMLLVALPDAINGVYKAKCCVHVDSRVTSSERKIAIEVAKRACLGKRATYGE
jgi:hypothetical protein